MKFIIPILIAFFLTSENSYASYEIDGQNYTYSHENGFSTKCTDIPSHHNHLIKIAHMERILESLKEAKTFCELKTGKICGIIAWGATMEETTTGSSACFARATATFLKK